MKCPLQTTLNEYSNVSLRSGYLGRPFENAVVVLIETFLTPRSQTHDSQTQLTQAHTRRTQACQILTGSLVEGAHKLRYHVKL